MAWYKQDALGNALFLKRMLIRIIGLLTHRRYRGFNMLKIQGSEIIGELPPNNE